MDAVWNFPRSSHAKTPNTGVSREHTQEFSLNLGSKNGEDLSFCFLCDDHRYKSIATDQQEDRDVGMT